MTFFILEDEVALYDHLCRLLALTRPDCPVVGPAATLAEARALLARATRQDVVFADIRLADGLVFSALEAAIPPCPVIFTTAYDEYALRAFDFHAVAYLLKPITADALRRALSRVTASAVSSDVLASLATLLREHKPAFRQRFLVEQADSMEVVGVDAVRLIQVVDGRTLLFTADGRRIAVPFTLDDIEADLDPSLFFRASRQHIIALRFVRLLHRWFHARLLVEIDGLPDVRIEVSRERALRLRRCLDC